MHRQGNEIQSHTQELSHRQLDPDRDDEVLWQSVAAMLGHVLHDVLGLKTTKMLEGMNTNSGKRAFASDSCGMSGALGTGPGGATAPRAAAFWAKAAGNQAPATSPQVSAGPTYYAKRERCRGTLRSERRTLTAYEQKAGAPTRMQGEKSPAPKRRCTRRR